MKFEHDSKKLNVVYDKHIGLDAKYKGDNSNTFLGLDEDDINQIITLGVDFISKHGKKALKDFYKKLKDLGLIIDETLPLIVLKDPGTSEDTITDRTTKVKTKKIHKGKRGE